ncbi:DNA polymerase III subunit beta [Schlesneria sp. T3-172]|uniref:DNA polymerase III subunit beta n=1 Tax=Schlesneria sphaerica TaxID=3373610 RepID=UPI0037CC45E7
MIEFDLKAFADSFATVAACVSARTTKDILKNVLFISDGSQITLTASDGEVHMRMQVDVAAEKCQSLIPAARMLSVLRELNVEAVELTPSDGKLHIKSGSATFDLQTADPKEFPPVPAFKASSYFKLDSVSLRKMIRQTIFACDEASARYALGGIQIECGPHRTTLAATDSRRLCVVSAMSGVEGHVETIIPVIPKRAMQLVEKSIHDTECHISIQTNDVAFRSGPVTILSQVIQGRFPDYRKVVPTQDSLRSRVQLIPKHVASLVRQANIATNEESRGVDLKFTKTELVVSSGAAEIGQAKVRMPISYDGPELTITLDGRYLGEYLKGLDETSIEVGLIAADDRVLFSQGDYLHVIMPLSRE